MRTSSGIAVASLVALLASAPAAPAASLAEAIAAQGRDPFRFCQLPTRQRTAGFAQMSAALVATGEVEPNNAAGTATFVPLGFGVGEDPQVDVTGTRNGSGDVDFFSFDLDPGDVFGAEVVGSTTLALRGPAAQLLMQSTQDFSSIFPAASPLPGDGSSSSPTVSWVAATSGRYTLALSGVSRQGYTLRLRIFRSPLESAAPGTRQIIFLDFNGASNVNAQALFGSGNSNATLSPLSSFLAGWGLGAANESAVIDAIVAAVNDGLSDLFGANNPAFDFELRNSRDHADPFGQPNVSRVIIGGTIQQLGISTIGIAESIDPGNFDTSETAVALLDLLSAAANNPNSINAIPRVGGIIPLVGKVVGNVAVHELGHYSASFHTENSTNPAVNDVRSVMDQGGESLAINIAGVGNDGTFGTGDDEEVDLAVDDFEQAEGLVGDEDTTNLTAFGLTSPGGPTPTFGPSPIPTNTPTMTPTVPIPTCNGLAATILGTTGDDTLSGTAANDVIVGLGGNDTILGRGGNDSLCGNEGDDSLNGGTGTDFCDGGSGATVLSGCETSGPGTTPTPTRTPTVGPSPTPTRTPTTGPTPSGPSCNGLPATIVGTDGPDLLLGGAGNDVIVGLGGNDDIRGRGGNDVLCGDGGDDVIDGSTGTDFCDGGSGTSSIVGCETGP